MNFAMKDMPNLIGIMAKPRFFHQLALSNASTATCRVAKFDVFLTPAHILRKWQSTSSYL